MKHLNGQFYAEDQDKTYISDPKETSIKREREEPKSFRTRYQVMNKTQRRRNQKVNENKNVELVVEPYPKKIKRKIE